MSRIMSASGFPCMEGDFPSLVHFWEEERKQADEEDTLGVFRLGRVKSLETLGTR